MGIYYRKRVKFFKGFNINFSRSGPSISVGPRGAKLNFSKRGVYASACIPGTGIYMRQKIAGGKMKKKGIMRQQSPTPVDTPIAVFILLGAIPIGFLLPVLTPLPWWSCFIVWVAAFFVGVIVASCEKENNALRQLAAESHDTECFVRCPEEIKKGLESDVAIDENMHAPNVCIIEKIVIKNADPLFKDAARFIVNEDFATTSKIQRHFQIGYARSGKIMDQLEYAGIVGAPSGARPRQILINGDGIERLLDAIQLEEESLTPEEEILARRAAMWAEIESQKSQEECEFDNKLKKARDIISLAANEEKKGMIKEAITHYEEVVSMEVPVKLPYDRLPILYRRFKNYEDEIRVLNTAIKVFTKENERRATYAIKLGYVDFTKAMQALETNECIRDEKGIILLSIYDINSYYDRLKKAKNLSDK